MTNLCRQTQFLNQLFLQLMMYVLSESFDLNDEQQVKYESSNLGGNDHEQDQSKYTEIFQVGTDLCQLSVCCFCSVNVESGPGRYEKP